MIRSLPLERNLDASDFKKDKGIINAATISLKMWIYKGANDFKMDKGSIMSMQ